MILLKRTVKDSDGLKLQVFGWTDNVITIGHLQKWEPNYYRRISVV